MEPMNPEAIEAALIEVITERADEAGWANLAELGAPLRQRGLQYKKLRPFLEEYDHLLIIKVDESLQPPVVYTKLKNQ